MAANWQLAPTLIYKYSVIIPLILDSYFDQLLIGTLVSVFVASLELPKGHSAFSLKLIEFALIICFSLNNAKCLLNGRVVSISVSVLVESCNIGYS